MGVETVVRAQGLGKNFKVASREGTGMKSAFKAFLKPTYKTVEAVAGVDLELPAGEIRALIGPNGAGKSTLIKMLCGVLHPSYGELSCLGVEPWKDRLEYVRRIGAVFGQKSQLTWDLPVTDSFTLNKKIYKVSDAAFKRSLDYFKDCFGLAAFMDRPVRSLSLGERMKCELVAALLHEPALVFLDEPTIGMDILAKDTVREFVRAVNRDRGVSFILTTHDLDDVENLCQRITVINTGKIVYDHDMTDLRGRFGGKKILELRFSRRVDASEIQGAAGLAEDGLSAAWELSGSADSYSEKAARIIATYPVADIVIRDPDIESIIRELYTNKSTQVD
jgi:ABC-2 type transport system ATP-binding protein